MTKMDQTLQHKIISAIDTFRTKGTPSVVHAPIQQKLIKAADTTSTAYPFVISAEIKDRDGDLVRLAGGDIERYNKNPIVAWMHLTRPYMSDGYDPDLIIGKGFASYDEDKRLINTIEFEPESLNPLAEKIRQKIDFGSLSAGSMGFIPQDGHFGKKDKGEDPSTFYITKWELLEYSIVTIGSNYLAEYQPNNTKLIQNPIAEKLNPVISVELARACIDLFNLKKAITP